VLEFADVAAAHQRIAAHVHRTPLFESSLLNACLGHRLLFKAENLQKIGAFKARGALNALLHLKEQSELPRRLVAFSSGNHAQAVAWAAAVVGTEAAVVMPETSSTLKRQAAASYGAEVILAAGRPEAEAEALRRQRAGALLLPPYDDDAVICGQGTACLEALQDGPPLDAAFVPVGGGGLLSGTYLACAGQTPAPLVFGGEPQQANDAARSLRAGQVQRYEQAPITLADGAQTLSLSQRTLGYAQRCAGVIEVDERAIAYWTQWLTHLLKQTVEPTAALGMAAADAWLATQTRPRTVLVLLSGGNLSAQTRAAVWQQNYLDELPDRESKERFSSISLEIDMAF